MGESQLIIFVILVEDTIVESTFVDLTIIGSLLPVEQKMCDIKVYISFGCDYSARIVRAEFVFHMIAIILLKYRILSFLRLIILLAYGYERDDVYHCVPGVRRFSCHGERA